MNSKKLLYTLLLGATLTSCTEVEICERDEHPHTGDVNFTYTWNKPEDKPKLMGVLCYRVVGQWKQVAEVNTDDLTLRFNKDKTFITPENPDEGDNTGGDNPGGDNTDVTEPTGPTETENVESVKRQVLLAYADEPTEPTEPSEPGTGTTPSEEEIPFTPTVKIPRGYYKFATFPLDNPSIDYSELEQFIEKDAANYPLQNVGLSYKVYDIKDPKLNKPLAWQDFNPYAKYIQPDVEPLYYDSTTVQRVRADRQTTFEFKPKILSQNIDINFNIVKNTDEVQFKVTEVWAEISGVPTYIKMNTGYLDITKTSKMLFKTDIKPSNPDDDGNDTNENKRIACHGNINVTGVVNVQRGYGETLADVRKKIYGPGIMQVVIYTEVYNPNTGHSFPQKWQGIINLYNTLNQAKLMKTTSDNKYVYRNGEHGAINISAEILLDGKTVGNIDKGGDALDRWIQTDSDINIDI